MESNTHRSKPLNVKIFEFYNELQPYAKPYNTFSKNKQTKKE